MSVEERVNRVLVDGIGIDPEEIAPAAELKGNLGIDSTEMVEVVVALEKEFKLKVPDGVIRCESTVKEVVDYFSRTLLN